MTQAHAGLAEMRELVRKTPVMKRYQQAGIAYSNVEVQETVVPGIYKGLNPTNHKPLFYMHEGLDYIVQSDGWSAVKPEGFELVQGKPAQFKLDVDLILSKFEVERDMGYVFGNGKKHAIVVDAFDCSHCRDFDAALDKRRKDYDAIAYILPTALIKSPENEKLIRNIWCSPNPGKVWHEVMTNLNYRVKQVDTSSCDPRKTMATSDEIASMMRLHGTPGFIGAGESMSGFPVNAKPDIQAKMLDWLFK